MIAIAQKITDQTFIFKHGTISKFDKITGKDRVSFYTIGLNKEALTTH